MRSGRLVPVGLLILLLPLANGCLWAPDLDHVRKDIERQLPGITFKRELALSLNPVALSLARTVVKLVPDAREAAAYLEDVRDVTVAVYEVQNTPQDLRIGLPDHLRRLIQRDGWDLTVKTCEGDESVWVLSQTDGGRVAGVYVVVLDRENLVLVQAHGRLESLVRKAIREHGHIGIDA
jgi:hypothetical protein